MVSVVQHGVRAVFKVPLFLFSAYYFVIHFLTPAVKHYLGYYRYTPHYDDSSLLMTALMTCFLYVLALFADTLIGRYSRYRCHVSVKNAELSEKSLRQLKIGALSAFSIGAIFAYYDFIQITQTIGLQEFMSDRHESAEARGGTRVLVNFMIVGLAMYSYVLATMKHSKKLAVLILAGMFVFASGYYILISSRNSILLLISLALVFYSAAKIAMEGDMPAVRQKSLLSLFVVVFVLFGLIYWTTIARYSQSDSVYAQERLNNIFLYMLDGAFGNDEAIIWFFQMEPAKLWGETYLAAMLSFVPRSWWPDKPLGAGPLLINMIFPGKYVVGAEGNNSLTTGLLTEVQMNFGFLANAFVIIFYVGLLRFFRRMSTLESRLFLRMMYILLFTLFSTVALYAEFLGFWARMLMFSVPLVFMHKIFKVRWWL